MCTYIWTCEAVHVSSTCVLLLSPGWALAVCMYLYATPCTWRARHVKVQMMNAKCIVAPAIFASPPSRARAHTHTYTHTHIHTHRHRNKSTMAWAPDHHLLFPPPLLGALCQRPAVHADEKFFAKRTPRN